jgi:hypothetical protein
MRTADRKLAIQLERALPFDPNRPLPSCVGGSRVAPPEDCPEPWIISTELSITQPGTVRGESRQLLGDLRVPLNCRVPTFFRSNPYALFDA